MRPVPSVLHRLLPFVLLGGLLSLFAAPAVAQPEGEGGAVRVGGGDALTIGGLLQTDLSLNGPQPNGFRIRSTRLRLGGEAQDLQYVIQTDFASSSILLDAFARLPLSETVGVRAGVFKAPFSAEILKSRPDLLFAERSRAANALPPGRQAGATLSATLVPDRLTATAGAFNGVGGLQTNDNDHLLYVGRLDGTVPLGSTTLEAGANAGYSVDDDVPRPGLGASFAGTRVLFGGDARLSGDRWLLAGEVNGTRFDPDGGADAQTAFGYYVAGGVDVAEGHQFLARFDHYDPDVPGRAAPDDRVALGYNYDPSSMLRFLLNYEAPTSDLGDGGVVARLQIALR